MEEKIVVAADFGNGKIAVAAALKKEENQIEMIDFKSKSAEDLVLDGKIVDETALASEVVAMIQQIETDNNLQIEKVHFAAAPHTLRSEIRKVSIETSDSDEILEELTEKAEEIEISDNRCVFEVVSLETTISGNSKAEGDFLVISTQNTVKQQFMELKNSALSVYKPQCFVAPLIEAEYFLNSEQKKNGALLIDMGLGCTSFTVYRGGLPRMCAVIPLGSKHITSDIVKSFDIKNSTAEKLKIAPEYGFAVKNNLKVGGKVIEADELKKVIFARLNEIFNFIFAEIKSQKLEYIREFVLVGGGAKMNFLPEFLKRISGAETKIADFEVITNDKTEGFICPKNALLFALFKNCDENCGKIKKVEVVVEQPVEPQPETKEEKKRREKQEEMERKQEEIERKLKEKEERRRQQLLKKIERENAGVGKIDFWSNLKENIKNKLEDPNVFGETPLNQNEN